MIRAFQKFLSESIKRIVNSLTCNANKQTDHNHERKNPTKLPAVENTIVPIEHRLDNWFIIYNDNKEQTLNNLIAAMIEGSDKIKLSKNKKLNLEDFCKHVFDGIGTYYHGDHFYDYETPLDTRKLEYFLSHPENIKKFIIYARNVEHGLPEARITLSKILKIIDYLKILAQYFHEERVARLTALKSDMLAVTYYRHEMVTVAINATLEEVEHLVQVGNTIIETANVIPVTFKRIDSG